MNESSLRQHERRIANVLTLVERASDAVATTSYVWGGLTLDVYAGRLLRLHGDIDILTVNLHQKLPALIQFFAQEGCETKQLINGDLAVQNSGVGIHLGHIAFQNDVVQWTHNGSKGQLFFPAEWLNPAPLRFCNQRVHVVRPELEYVLKTHPHLLNKKWMPREKDKVARAQLAEVLDERDINRSDLINKIWSNRSKRP